MNEGDFVDFAYTGAEQTIELDPGTYLLEAWGAQGGGGSGGLGGYASGKIALAAVTTLRVYVGGRASGITGGWNGGGNGGGGSGQAGGGGGTDFRIGATYADRLLVAGGGGGQGTSAARGHGHGGGLVGVNSASGGGGDLPGTGGTQSAGGTVNGAFGTGGNTSGSYPGGGGGGGWFGGGGGRNYGGAGGGSSYIGGTVTVGAITYPLVPIVDGTTTAGQRSGDGAARITCLSGGGGPVARPRGYAIIIG